MIEEKIAEIILETNWKKDEDYHTYLLNVARQILSLLRQEGWKSPEETGPPLG